MNTKNIMNQLLFNDYSSDSPEELLKSLSIEVIRKCAQFNIKLSSNFVSLAVELFSMHPTNGISFNVKISECDANKFIENCVSQFQNLKDSPSLKTIEMQAAFINSKLDLQEISHKSNKKANLVTEILLKEITEIQATTKDEQDKCFQKIVIDIILSNKLGNPRNSKVIAETSSALKSVMSRADLMNFLSLNKGKRLETLRNIRDIVCGIRLFNKDAGHCGEGIPDIITDLPKTFKNVKSYLCKAYQMLLKHIELLQKFILNSFAVNTKTNEITFNYTEFITNDLIEFSKDVILMNSQHVKYLKHLIELMNEFEKEIDKTIDEYTCILKNLHEIVQFRVAIAADKVFPHFIQLAKLWHSLLNLLNVVNEVDHLNGKLLQIGDIDDLYACTIEEMVNEWEKNESGQRNEKESEESKPLNLIAYTNQCQLVENIENLTISTFNKFCTYLFIIGNGLLIPSQLSMGLIQFKGKNYAFSKEEYAKLFTQNPESYIEKQLEIIRMRPATIIFFDLFDEIRNQVFDMECSTVESDEFLDKVKLNQEIQTELHPIPYHKDYNYTWNIWDLSRHAIKLTDIKKCRTHSAQTDISYHRMNVDIQVDLPARSTQTQTGVDSSTNTLKFDQLKLSTTY